MSLTRRLRMLLMPAFLCAGTFLYLHFERTATPTTRLDLVTDAKRAMCPRFFLHETFFTGKKWEMDEMGTWGVPITDENDMPLWWMRDTDQMNMLGILLWRLTHGYKCKPTAVAEDADVVLIPLFPPPESPPPETQNEHYAFVPPDLLARFGHVCRVIIETDWHKVYPDLSERTAHKYMFVTPGMTATIGFCTQSDPTWYHKLGASKSGQIVSQFMWGSVSSGVSNAQCDADTQDEQDPTLSNFLHCPHYMRQSRLVRIPLASSVHSAALHRHRTEPWNNLSAPRPILINFVGSTHGKPSSQEIRQFLDAKCQHYSAIHGNHSCLRVAPTGDFMLRAMRAKQQSVFCLEPPGYDDVRKSMIDSMTVGCIPVLFDIGHNETAHFWQPYWDSWRSDSCIIFKWEEVRDGTKDVLASLQAIAPEQRLKMQKTIARSAHRLQAAYDNYESDAVDIMMADLARIGRTDLEPERRSQCLDYGRVLKWMLSTASPPGSDISDDERPRDAEQTATRHAMSCNDVLDRNALSRVCLGNITVDAITVPGASLCRRSCKLCER